jgi:hypothetical protein
MVLDVLFFQYQPIVPEKGAVNVPSDFDNVAEFLSGTDPTVADSDGMLNVEEFCSNSDPERYVIHLDAGWNLVSLGTQPQEHSVTGIFGDAHQGAVWMWQDGRFVRATELQPLKG